MSRQQRQRQPLTPGEQIVQTLSALGYSPARGPSAFVIDFTKTYASVAGEVVCVRVQFDKPVLGQPAPILGSIIVTTQTVLPPTLDAAAGAPEAAQEDLRSIIAEFSGDLPERSVDLRLCIKCGTKSPEFYVINDDAVCLACVEERRNG